MESCYGIKDGSSISMVSTVSQGEGWCCCMGFTVPAGAWIKGSGGAVRTPVRVRGGSVAPIYGRGGSVAPISAEMGRAGPFNP